MGIGYFIPGGGGGMKLTACLDLMPRLRLRGALLPFNHTPLRCSGDDIITAWPAFFDHCEGYLTSPWMMAHPPLPPSSATQADLLLL
jgi:hypothetical protein